jgi:hypothetical protein
MKTPRIASAAFFLGHVSQGQKTLASLLNLPGSQSDLVRSGLFGVLDDHEFDEALSRLQFEPQLFLEGP